MIYDDCLFVGEVAPYSESEIKRPLPYVTLLRACKKIKLEAEPIVYKNKFILANEGAVEKLFEQTFPTRERKLLLKSVELSLQSMDFTREDISAACKDGFDRWFTMVNAGRSHLLGTGRAFHHCVTPQQIVIAWQRKVDPILDHLALNQLVLDLSDSFCYCHDTHKARMAAMAIRCFEKGFRLRAPNLVKVKGWDDAGRADAEVVVRVLLKTWTMRRADHLVGSSQPALENVPEAEAWFSKVACEEEWQVAVRSDFFQF